MLLVSTPAVPESALYNPYLAALDLCWRRNVIAITGMLMIFYTPGVARAKKVIRLIAKRLVDCLIFVEYDLYDKSAWKR